MKVIYSLLHFANRTPKRLCISIPNAMPDLTKAEGVIISISSEDSSHSFALNSSEIEDFIYALSYTQSALLLRRIVAINQKYFTKEVKE